MNTSLLSLFSRHQPIFTPHFTCRVCEQASTMIHPYIHTSITLSLAKGRMAGRTPQGPDDTSPPDTSSTGTKTGTNGFPRRATDCRRAKRSHLGGSFCVICTWRSGDLVSLVSEVAPRSSSQVKSSQVAPRSKDRLTLSTSSRVAYAPPQYMQQVEERNGGMRDCHNQQMTSQKLSDQVLPKLLHHPRAVPGDFASL